MNNNQNVNNSTSFGMLNTSNTPQQAVPTTPSNGVNMMPNQAPNQVPNSMPNVAPNQMANTPSNQVSVAAPVSGNQNNVVTLGEVSNVTYADTIGNIDYGTQPENIPEVPVQNQQENFINNDYNETSISDLNVEGTYNNMNVAPDYSTDPKVKELLHPEENTTIKIGKDLKIFILIAVVLLVFIFVMPYMVDVVKKIIYH